MSLKRSFVTVDSGPAPHKRMCSMPDRLAGVGGAWTAPLPGGTTLAAAGAAPEVLQWLHALSHNAHNLLAEANLSEHTWQCFAEFNLLCEANFNAVPTSAIRGYHSFTRMPKGMLAERYLQSHGQPTAGCSMVPPGTLFRWPGPLPLHARMVLFVLDKAFASYQDAAVARYSLEAPAWLSQWCARWGLRPAADGIITMTTVHAYAPASDEVRVIYVPSFGQ